MTSALIYGERASLEIEGDRVTLADRSGKVEDLSVADIADDSYHAAWFAGVAEEFERAVAEGPNSPIALRNVAEARVSLALIDAARQSAARKGIEITFPF
jgi:predicted dehydrogenase